MCTCTAFTSGICRGRQLHELPHVAYRFDAESLGKNTLHG